MRIYTSYFRKAEEIKAAGLATISIAQHQPRWIKPGVIDGVIQALAPDAEWLAWAESDREKYLKYYHARLAVLDVEEITARIAEIAAGKAAVLLCYERPGEFCHRRIVANWLEEHAGIVVPEWAGQGSQFSLF